MPRRRWRSASPTTAPGLTRRWLDACSSRSRRRNRRGSALVFRSAPRSCNCMAAASGSIRPRRARPNFVYPCRSGRPRDMATVFVIDDQHSVRHALAEMLSVFGFEVETYESAASFLHSLKPAGPGCCIVADVRMPGMDGIELTRELARRGIGVPIVLISGHADVPMAVAGIKAGAEDFIEKPLDDRELIAAINRGLARAS